MKLDDTGHAYAFSMTKLMRKILRTANDVSTHPSPANMQLATHPSPTNANKHVLISNCHLNCSVVAILRERCDQLLVLLHKPNVETPQDRSQFPWPFCTHGCSLYAMFASALYLNLLSLATRLEPSQLLEPSHLFFSSPTASTFAMLSRVLLLLLAVANQRRLLLSYRVMMPEDPAESKTHMCLKDISTRVNELLEVEIKVAIS